VHVVEPQVAVSGSGVCVQVLVPLHSRCMQSLEVQEIGVPAHSPPPQVSS
jgi:hypothetical protein